MVLPGCTWLGHAFSLDVPFGKDSEGIITRWGSQGNSKNSKKSKNSEKSKKSEVAFPNLSKSPLLVRLRT
jgi:hypothetical protein